MNAQRLSWFIEGGDGFVVYIANTFLLIALMMLNANSLFDQRYSHEQPGQLPSYEEVAEVAEPQAEAIAPDYALPPVVDGMVPVVLRIPTQKPVVFLTIDDGQHQLPIIRTLLKENRLRASIFLTDNYVKTNQPYFEDFVTDGSLVENHTISHRALARLSYGAQREEICGAADVLGQRFGRRPTLFRPPFGSYNRDTRRAAADCGMKALIYWSAVAEDGKMHYQNKDRLYPGDIVLMHFRPTFASDLLAFIEAQKAAGLQVELLEDWLH